jgi:tetratricopeptide (TPR) repeat protein
MARRLVNLPLPRWILLLVVLLAPMACRSLPKGAEARSLDGRALTAPVLPDEARAALEADLAAARERLAADPGDRDAAIWVGRRLGYLGRYREAIDVYSAALRRHPDDPFLLRHRGHRWITVREFDRAAADLRDAARACRDVPDEVEPDGQPTPGREPHSTLHYNVHYHLGLAQFLRGRFAAAERAWLDALAVAGNDESRAAVCHWLWSVRMRRGNPAGAMAAALTVHEGMDVVENVGYLRLCLYYTGRLAREAITAGEGSSGAAVRFGLAHHDLVLGDPRSARQQLRELAAEPGWAAFGVIAAEAELDR